MAASGRQSSTGPLEAACQLAVECIGGFWPNCHPHVRVILGPAAQVLNDLQRDNHALRSRVSALEPLAGSGGRAASAGSVGAASARPPRPSTGSCMQLLGSRRRSSASPGSPIPAERSSGGLGVTLDELSQLQLDEVDPGLPSRAVRLHAFLPFGATMTPVYVKGEDDVQ